MGNSFNFGARQYDSRIARWYRQDPKSKKGPNWSTYKAFMCNPIRYSDPDGQWEWDEVGNLTAQKGDQAWSLASFLGTSVNNSLNMLARSGYQVNEKGILNLKVGEKIYSHNLYIVEKDVSGAIVDGNLEAVNHYFKGNGEPADVGDNTTDDLIYSMEFIGIHEKIKGKGIEEETGNFGVNLTMTRTNGYLSLYSFHAGRTRVDYQLTNSKQVGHVKYSLFGKDGFCDPDYPEEYKYKLFNYLSMKIFGAKFFPEPDGYGPMFEFEGGTPYHYKNRTIEYFFKPSKRYLNSVKENKEEKQDD